MARLRSIRLLHRFAQIDTRRRALLAEATAALMLARLALFVVSFPRLAQRFGTLVSPTDPRVLKIRGRADPTQAFIANEVSWAVTRAACYLPFGAVCLPQAMAAHTLLKRRGVAGIMHFGAVRGENKPLDTHAWLDAAGVAVTGYPVDDRLAEIACFICGFAASEISVGGLKVNAGATG